MSADPQAMEELKNKLIEEREYLDQLCDMPDIIPKALEYCQVVIRAIDFVINNDTQSHAQQCQVSFLVTVIWSIKRYLGSLQRQDLVLHVLLIQTFSILNTTPSIPDELHNYVVRIGEIAEEYVNEVRNARSAHTSTDVPTPTASVDNTTSQGFETVPTCELSIPPGGNVHSGHETFLHSHGDTNVPTPRDGMNEDPSNATDEILGNQEQARTPRLPSSRGNHTEEDEKRDQPESQTRKRSSAECSGRKEKRARKE